MIEHIPAAHRYVNRMGFLTTAHLFSFADYYDPKNVHFGALRVFNDDTIAAHSGFPNHPHADMEIVTIVLEGELVHKDNMGNRGVIAAGEVQYMSAGLGVIHAETNESAAPVHLYQIWIMPRVQGLVPAYAQKDFNGLLQQNALTKLISGNANTESLVMQADAIIYRGLLDAENKITHICNSGFGVFVYVTTGSLQINGVTAEEGDQLRITGDQKIEILAHKNSDFILIEAAC